MFANGDRHIELLAYQARAFGFFVNPNTNAIMLLLLSLPGLALFELTGRNRYLLCSIFVYSTVLLTASRTGLILAGLVLVLLGIASRKFKYLVALAVVAWISLGALEYLVNTGVVRDWFPYLTELLVKVDDALHGSHFDAESIPSFSARLMIWEDSLSWFRQNPVWGAGPLRDVIPSFADNYYVYLLSRYGIMGLVSYGVFTFYTASLSIYAMLNNVRPQRELGMLTLASLVIVNVANFAIDAFLSVPIAALCLLYVGYLTSLSDLSRSLSPGRRAVRLRPTRAVAVLESIP
jgi:O-antigen ligase